MGSKCFSSTSPTSVDIRATESLAVGEEINRRGKTREEKERMYMFTLFNCQTKLKQNWQYFGATTVTYGLKS